MSKSNDICHDLKTERPDVGQPLPGALRVLPVAFYAALVASVALTTVFYIQLRQAGSAKAKWQAKEASTAKATKNLENVLESVKAEAKRANEVVAWVEGTREFQKLCLTVTRSMTPDATIAEFLVDRQKNNPAQLQVGIKLNGRSLAQQIESTLAELEKIYYRPYSPIQEQGKGTLRYNATFIHQQPTI